MLYNLFVLHVGSSVVGGWVVTKKKVLVEWEKKRKAVRGWGEAGTYSVWGVLGMVCELRWLFSL